jgi:hypothetical protein
MRAVETPIGVDRFIGKQQPTPLAATNQQFHVGALEAEFLGQVHGLAAAMHE